MFSMSAGNVAHPPLLPFAALKRYSASLSAASKGSRKMSQERPTRQVASEQDARAVLAAPDGAVPHSDHGSSTAYLLDLKQISQSHFPHDLPASLRKDEIVAHLDLICNSAAFAPSKRCQQFLRYIVLETLEGRGELIKERNIANDVFGKGSEFEPGEDSLVRVKAREVRKRLSDFYKLSPPDVLQIDLPVGGYFPRIYCSQPSDAKNEPVHTDISQPANTFSRRKLLWMLSGATGIAGGLATWQILKHHATPLERLWAPVFATKAPLVVFIPVLRDAIGGEISDRVGIGPTAALRRAADFLTEHHYPYHLRFGTDLTFAQLREQPSLLLGGFSSIWTQLMISNLRFSLVWNSDISQQSIVDTKTRQVWRAVNRTSAGYADLDYGILCRLFDKESGQIAMIAGGITTFGTEGAASVFFDPNLFDQLIKQAPKNWEEKNIEAVVRVSIIGTTPSSPQLIATNFW